MSEQDQSESDFLYELYKDDSEELPEEVEFDDGAN